MKRLLATAGLLAGLGAAMACWNGATTIDGITTADALAIRAAVQSRLEALSNDDAARAFAPAMAEQHASTGNPGKSPNRARQPYNPLHRYRRALFAEPRISAGKAIQMARITDEASHVWVAIFRLRQEQGKYWKIDACQLLRTDIVAI